MICIKYKLGKSKIHGIGIFANENIKKNQLIYKASPKLDVELTPRQFKLLNKKEKEEFLWWGYFNKDKNIYHVDFGASKFINHSVDSNLTQKSNHKDAYLIAKREIKKGEELTQNYLEFETIKEFKKRFK